jgi:hypothetical protein
MPFTRAAAVLVLLAKLPGHVPFALRKGSCWSASLSTKANLAAARTSSSLNPAQIPTRNATDDDAPITTKAPTHGCSPWKPLRPGPAHHRHRSSTVGHCSARMLPAGHTPSSMRIGPPCGGNGTLDRTLADHWIDERRHRAANQGATAEKAVPFPLSRSSIRDDRSE